MGMARTQRHAVVSRLGRGAAALSLLLLASLPLSGCKTPKVLCFKSSGLGTLAFTSTEASNGGRAVTIDLVFVTEKPVYQALSKMKAHDYFTNHEQLERDFPKGYRFTQWQVQPGQYLEATAAHAPCNLIATYIFVDYRGDGEFRQRLGKEKRGTLVLGEKDFKWIPEKG